MSEMSLYQHVITKTRYAKWRPEDGRREEWPETCERYFEFFDKHLGDKAPSPNLRAHLKESMVSMGIQPSMRSLMTAGAALEKFNAAAFNCFYEPIDSIRSFSEMMYLLMCGGGVGFSVEREVISHLPTVPDSFDKTSDVIVVADSREGWCKAFNKLLGLLFAGVIPEWDVSKVRPAGSRLKTFGGYASGPAPLEELFRHTIKMFKQASGRKFKPSEVFSICCFIAQIIVVGGVRRSATICLFDLDDSEMRNIKGPGSNMWVQQADGKWVPGPNAHYAMANISAVFESKPNPSQFMSFWMDLMNAGSGEPGIFNREAYRRNATACGRSNKYENGEQIKWGTNPCSLPGDQYILTTTGYETISSLVGTSPEVVVHGKAYKTLSPFAQTGHKYVYDVATEEGFEFAGTDNHEFQLTDGTWKRLDALVVGDEVSVHDHRDNRGVTFVDDQDDMERGWLLGSIVGDGGFNPEKYPTYLRFWGDEKASLGVHALNLANKHFDAKMGETIADGRPFTVRSSRLNSFADKYLSVLEKEVKDSIYLESKSFLAGFCRGYFDADGTVVGNGTKGISVRLGSISLPRLKAVQKILLSLGVYSKIYTDRKAQGLTLMPDGKGGEALYATQAMHELVVSRDAIDVFNEVVGFESPAKAEKLKTKLGERVRAGYKTSFKARVTGVTKRAEAEPVYDAEVDVVKCFDCNGVVAHNSEIQLRPYQGCNLTAVAVRENDTLEDLKEKITSATILGTWQTTLTDFSYLKKAWKENMDEERLLGVCLTGIYDHPVLSHVSDESARWLKELAALTWTVNAAEADRLGIPHSTCTTAVKPAGNSGEAYDTASGIHPRYAPYYIRTIRQSKTDPMTQFLITAGVPAEVSSQNDRDMILSFPMKAPESSTLFAGNLGAINQLKHWLHVKENFTSHTVSCTIYVRSEEWISVGAWVYENFDKVTGLSFLPFDDHVYPQAPIQPCSKEEYEKAVEAMPKTIDWNLFALYDKTDTTTTGQEMACVGGACTL